MKYANTYLRHMFLIYIPVCVALGIFACWISQCAEDFACKIVVLLFGATIGIFYPVYILIFQNYVFWGKYAFDAEKVTFKLCRRVYSLKWESGVDAGIVSVRVGQGVYELYFYISTAYQDRRKRDRLISLARQRHHQDIIYFNVDSDELPTMIEYLPASLKSRVVYDALKYDLPIKSEAKQ